MDWLVLKNVSSIIMLLGALIMCITGIVFLVKEWPDEETAHKQKKAGTGYIVASIIFLVLALFF